MLIVADRAAPREAKELANYFWERRHAFDPHPLTAAQAIDRALAYRGEGYVVINESSDNPGSGCPGDGTHLLRELVQRDVPGSVFCFLYDPETARQAHEAGVGATIPVRIGGKTVPICGAPLALEVQVMHLSDGNFRYVSPQNYGVAVCLGLTARLRHGNVDIIVASFRTQTFDDRPLVITGGDPEQYKLICLKSAGHFRAYFQDRAGLIVPCEMPGLRSTDLRSYPYQKVRRPIYPLDGEAAYPEDLGGISMSTECKIIRDFQRPDPALVELFRDLPVANIDDNMGRTGAVEAAIVPFGKGQLLGTAFTVQVPPGDNLMLHAAMDLAKPGDVIVIDAGGNPERAIFGELMATYCKTRGVRGIVCDGAIRDAQKLSELEDFPVYAKAVTPNGPFKNGPGQINVPITVGGKTVCPGDIVVGDSDGIVFIRPENAVALAEATRQTGRMEAQILQEILEKGTYIRPWVDELLEKCNCQYE